ncbi:MAG: response regulator [Nitrospirota bacterium]|nr:response regulator [Nitrospirota bacterium]
MPTILLIEDHAGVRELLAIALRTDGYTVITAENGSDGVARFQEQSCDLVLTDMSMPVMTGPEAIRHIQQLSPTTPIIGMSGGFPDQLITSERQRLGLQGFFSKPMELHALRHCIGTLLSHLTPCTVSAA